VPTIAEWLASLGLSEYARCFAENEIDTSVLPHLTDQDLKDLGVRLGHRRKMLHAIAELERGEAKPHVAAEPVPGEESGRRQLTVMFCDLVGSTALSAHLDPEDLQTVIGAYHGCIAKVIGRYGGIIARYMGDGVLAYFGYPQAHEDDAEQATRAGLALVEAVASLRTNISVALQVRVGIATGTVVVGPQVGEGTSREQTVVGEAPNLAARLQSLAEPGTVVISASTHRLTGGHFEYRDLGAETLKGWSEPTPVWQVIGTSGVESRFEATHKSELPLPPLLGREEEIELLSRRWRLIKRAEGRVVMLTGEPGIGKSHIVLAFDQLVRAEPHVTLRYFCSAHHNNSALFPFVSQLQRAARFERSDSSELKLAKLQTMLAAPAEDVAIVANLLSLPPDGRYHLPELTPQKRKQNTFAALLAQLDALAARQQVLIIFEDAHWADPTSLELLAAMVERVPKLRVLLLITARPEFTPPWPSYAHVTTLSLTRLNRRDGAALVERVTGGRALPEQVMDQILARTDGVPLFVEELTKTVLESELMRERDGRYVLERPLPSLAIPATLHDSLMARLDRLAPVRDVAQIGAVVGREFSYELVQAVSGLRREKLEDALDELARSELIFRRGEIPQAVYTFKHALVRDAAYAGLLKVRRAQLHASIATVFEQRYPELVQSQPETLAHHFTEAGLIGKAVGYWLQAGKNAALRSANVEAIAHLERGIGLVGQLPDGANKDRSELDLIFVLGSCLIATQGPASSKAMATFGRARELCERIGDPPEYLQVMFWLVTASVIRGELPQAQEEIAALLSLAQARDDRPALLNAMRGQAMIHLFMGRIKDAHAAIERACEAFSDSSEADRMAARAAGQDAGVANLALMSWALWILGHVDEAVKRIAAAVERADTVRHPHTQAYACYYASVLHALRGEPVIASGYAERCLALSQEHGFRQWLGLSRAVSGICVGALDASSTALEEVMTALGEYRAAGYQLGITALYVLLAPVLLLRNRVEAGLEIIEQGLSIVDRNSERIFEAELYRLKARALLRLDASNDRNATQSLLDEALSTARAQQARSLELRAARDLAALWIGQGRRDEACDILTPVCGWFASGSDTPDLKSAKALLDQRR